MVTSYIKKNNELSLNSVVREKFKCQGMFPFPGCLVSNTSLSTTGLEWYFINGSTWSIVSGYGSPVL